MFGHILLALVLAAIAGALVVPFVIGFVRGPQPGQTQPAQAGSAEPMRPLSWTARLDGRFLILYLVATAYFLSRGFDGGGPQGSVCVDTAYPYDGAAWGFAARPGASVRAGGDVTACALHPSDGGSIVVDVLLFGPLKALVPVPALAGAALLTFGRITRVGAVMDEELKATV